MRDPRFDPIVTRFVAWASDEPSVRSALVIGSQARSRVPADRWSDLDIVVFATAPSTLLDSAAWVETFGTVIVTFVESTAGGAGRERRVLYADGLDVDFSVFPVIDVATLLEVPEARAVFARGHEVLVDKDRRWQGLRLPEGPSPRSRDAIPGAAAFHALASDFWYHVLWTAKKLGRGELWTAKSCCDGYLKRLLLRLLEWHVTVDSGGAVDVWHDGRFLEQWVPPELRARIPSTFATYDRQDLARALGETGRLFADVARRVSRKTGYTYPEEVEKDVRALVSGVLAPGVV